jgi:4'-phosphopantetheinyl transferase
LNFASSLKTSYPTSYEVIHKDTPIKAFFSATLRGCRGPDGRAEATIRDTINPMTSRISAQPASLLWPKRGLPAEIASREVHVWAWTFTGPAEPSAADISILDDHERKRTARFYFAPDKVRYSLCHANMRRILASYLTKTPESLIYREAEGGKPELALEGTDPPLHFNLSHSKSIALLAVTLHSKVGVDVEDIRPIERDVATRFFSPAELASMATLDGEEWLDAFYRCWTRKEAILKIEGMGLRIPLDSFDVSVRADEPAALLAARPKAKLTAHWHLQHLAPADGSMGALALGDNEPEITTSWFVADSE